MATAVCAYTSLHNTCGFRRVLSVWQIQILLFETLWNIKAEYFQFVELTNAEPVDMEDMKN